MSWGSVAHAVQYTVSISKVGSSANMKYNTSDTNMTISGLDAGSLYLINGLAWDPEGRKGEGSSYVNQTTREICVKPLLQNVVIERELSPFSNRTAHTDLGQRVCGDDRQPGWTFRVLGTRSGGVWVHSVPRDEWPEPHVQLHVQLVHFVPSGLQRGALRPGGGLQRGGAQLAIRPSGGHHL